MNITKDNILPVAQDPSSKMYFADLDCYYNFKRTFEDAKCLLRTAKLYTEPDSELERRLLEIQREMDQLNIES
jgi:hypothetical protein